MPYDQDDKEDRDKPLKNPMKWILLITAVLLVGAWLQDRWGGHDDWASRANPGQWGDQGQWAGQGQWGERGQRAGDAARDLKELTGFTSVSVSGSTRLELTVGGDASVSLSGEEGAINAIHAYVKDGTLMLEQPRNGWGWGKGRVVARVTVPSLGNLSVAGSNTVDIKGVTSGDSRIVVSGAGRLTAQGRLDSLSLVINGTGKVDFDRLAVGAATVVLNGAGGVNIAVRKSLDATVNGAGNVRYTGAPEKVTTSVNGFGSIRRG